MHGGSPEIKVVFVRELPLYAFLERRVRFPWFVRDRVPEDNLLAKPRFLLL
jgi:hypothetical protein